MRGGHKCARAGCSTTINCTTTKICVVFGKSVRSFWLPLAIIYLCRRSEVIFFPQTKGTEK